MDHDPTCKCHTIFFYQNHDARVFPNIPFFNTFLLINLTLIFFFTPFIFPIPVVQIPVLEYCLIISRISIYMNYHCVIYTFVSSYVYNIIFFHCNTRYSVMSSPAEPNFIRGVTQHARMCSLLFIFVSLTNRWI